MHGSQTRRKCRCCNHLFVPDPRTADRQRYCSAPACRHASKAATGSTLQEDIAATARQLLLRGRNILGLVSSEITQRQLNLDYDQQIFVTTATAAPHPPKL